MSCPLTAKVQITREAVQQKLAPDNTSILEPLAFVNSYSEETSTDTLERY